MADKKTILVAAALVVIVAVAAVAVLSLGGSDEEPTSVTATVWLDNGDGEAIEYEGTGPSLRGVLEDALSDHDVSVGSNGNVSSVDGKGNSREGTWAVFRWSSPNGWSVYSDGSSNMFDGMVLAVSYAERVVGEDGTVTYSAPDIDVEFTVYYFVQFKEQYNSSEWMRDLPLTDADKQAGIWISGTGSNNNEALADAIISTFYPNSEVEIVEGDNGGITYVVDGEEGLFSYGTRTDMYGWFLSFFGWGDTKAGEGGDYGSWTYWSQYSYNPSAGTLDNSDYWDYNNYSFGMYDISKYRYFGLVLQTTTVEGTSASLPVPSTVPSGL